MAAWFITTLDDADNLSGSQPAVRIDWHSDVADFMSARDTQPPLQMPTTFINRTTASVSRCQKKDYLCYLKVESVYDELGNATQAFGIDAAYGHLYHRSVHTNLKVIVDLDAQSSAWHMNSDISTGQAKAMGNGCRRTAAST